MQDIQIDNLVELVFGTSVFEWVVRGFAILSSFYGIVSFCRNYMSRTVALSIGSFRIKRKYYDVQNITNIVSVRFYEGGQVPSEIRREILELTCPKITNLCRAKE